MLRWIPLLWITLLKRGRRFATKPCGLGGRRLDRLRISRPCTVIAENHPPRGIDKICTIIVNPPSWTDGFY